MGIETALIAATLVSAGTAAYSASQQKKAANAGVSAAESNLEFTQGQAAKREAMLKDLIKGGAFEFEPVDASAAAGEALSTTTANLPGILSNTDAVYNNAATNIRRFLTESFGKDASGKDMLPQMTDATNSAVLDMLKGRLSEGTRTLLGQRAVATGATSLGRGPVQDAYTYALGLTSEQQVQQGITAYQNLYQTYGRFAPQITGLDLLPYGGLSTNAAIQNAQFNSQGEFQAGMAKANAVLGNVDAQTQMIYPALQALGQAQQGPILAQAQMGQAIGQGVAGLLGTYASTQLIQNPNALYQTGSIGGVPNYAESSWSSLNRSALPSNYYLGGVQVRAAEGVAPTALRSGGSFGGGNSYSSNAAIASALRNLFRPN